jgi:hypothetical protein
VSDAYSMDSYRRIITRALESGYTFVPFLPEPAAEKRLYLRHDVDYSLTMALEVARANADMGVSGTFFVLLRSQIYNLLSPFSLKAVQQIHDLGQHIAFHAAVPEDAGEAEIIDALRADFAYLQRNVPFVQPVFAWHNPTADILSRFVERDELAGLLSTYSRRLTRATAYYSDSNLRNSVETFLKVVSADAPAALQLVLHPINWVAGGASMPEIFARAWQHVIRDRELDFRLNRVYGELLPDGMPADVLDQFSRAWRDAAARSHELLQPPLET